VRLKVKTADPVDEHQVAMVVGRCAQFDGVTVRGVTTDVEAILHVRADKGSYHDVPGVLDEPDSDQYRADDVFVISTTATGRGINVCTPIRGEGGDPIEAQFRQEVGVALAVDEERRDFGGEGIATRPFKRAVGRRDDVQRRVDAANVRRYTGRENVANSTRSKFPDTWTLHHDTSGYTEIQNHDTCILDAS
jgi:hypothetical protein